MNFEIPLNELTIEQVVRITLRKIITLEGKMAEVQAALEEQGIEIARVSSAVNEEIAKLLAELEDAQSAWEATEAQLVQEHLAKAQATAEGIRSNTAQLAQILADEVEDPEEPGDPEDPVDPDEEV